MLKKLFQNCCLNFEQDEEDGKNLKFLKNEDWYRRRYEAGKKYESKDMDTGVAYFDSSIR